MRPIVSQNKPGAIRNSGHSPGPNGPGPPQGLSDRGYAGFRRWTSENSASRTLVNKGIGEDVCTR
jgi:hypothetical protein